MKDILGNFILPGLRILPAEMRHPEAMAMLFAIGMQESRFEHRLQVGGGPAHGFFQFERGGINGVLDHHATYETIRQVCSDLVVKCNTEDCYDALIYNDPLACCFARLLLWTLPEPLPTRGEHEKGWEQYLSAWRPGKPHPETWKSYFNTAWVAIV